MARLVCAAAAVGVPPRLRGSVVWAISTFSPLGSLSSNGLRMRVCVCLEWHSTE